MRLLLMVPPLEEPIPADLSDVFEDIYGTYPPIGLLSLAACVRERTRHTVSILDPQARGLDRVATLACIATERPDVVGISALSFHMPDVLALVGGIRRVLPDARVILGGPHAHIYPVETAAQEGVDAVFLGEAEDSLPLYLDAIESGRDLATIPGVVLGDRPRPDAAMTRPGRSIATIEPSLPGVPSPIKDLDALPLPARDLLDVRHYSSITGRGGPLTTMMSSRGCPYSCTFCDRPQLGKLFRFHSPGRIVRELEDATALGVREAIFFDDTFSVRRGRVMELAAMLEARALGLLWDARTRVDLVDPPMLVALRRAGLKRLSFGVESGTQEVLDTLQKGTTPSQIRQAVRWSKDAGLEVHLDFMIGSPRETLAQVEDTIALAIELDPDYVQFTATTPYPATALYRLAIARGIVAGDVWAQFARAPHAGFQPPLWEETLSRAQIVALVERAYRSFYLRPRYIARKLFTRGFVANARRYMGAAVRVAAGSYVRTRPAVAGGSPATTRSGAQEFRA